MTIDPGRVRAIQEELQAYGHHRDERFMTRKVAKQADLLIADLIEALGVTGQTG